MRYMFKTAGPAMLLLPLAACGGGDPTPDDKQAAAPAPVPQDRDPLASSDPAPGEASQIAIPDAAERPVMQAQVVLERLGFSSGVVDGEEGMRFETALRGFQESRGLPVTGKLDQATRRALSRWDNIPATRIVTIPRDWGGLEFAPVPDDPAEQAKMERLGYESLAEKLAERFHTTPAVLARLNPGGEPARRQAAGQARSAEGNASTLQLGAGQKVRVPNIGSDRIDASTIDDKDWLRTLRALGVGTGNPEVSRIVVDKSGSWLKAFDSEDRLVAIYTVTTGSRHDPLPLGTWGVNGVAYNPPFSYDPELFWDVPDSEQSRQLPPGPNGPVGVVWIDLTKEHYGIHGTSAPDTIGEAESHGCVRLTNWDAARLAQMVTGSTTVVFRQ